MSASFPHWLVLGASGMLGRALRKEAEARGDITVTAWSRRELDLATPAASWPDLPEGVTHVVNAAAYTAVDEAETNAALADRINGHAVAELGERCADAGVMLAHFSTDYVFSGDRDTPWPVDATRRPANAYGRSKAIGEAALEALAATRGLHHLTLRTSWLYAPWGNNFVLTMRRLVAERDVLSVVDDQHGRPTSAVHLAAMTADLLAAGATGIHHATDGGHTTWHGLAREVAGHLNWRGELTACTSDRFPRPAARPRWSVLDLTATEDLIGPRACWRRHVQRALEAAAPC